MKQRFLLIVLALMAMTTGVNAAVIINETNFPDDAFRNFVLAKFDTNKDNILSEAEIPDVTDINVSNMGIYTLKGIEYFTKLHVLRCDNNNISELDLSKNTELRALECLLNNLKTLDLSKNTELHLVECFGNKINGKDMDDLIASLPINSKTNKQFTVCGKGYSRLEYDIPINEGNVCTTEQVAAAKARGWTPFLYDGTGESGRNILYEGSDPVRININYSNFPDENFRKYVQKKFDKDNDWILSEYEIRDVTNIKVSNMGIYTLKGIEHFTELQILWCDNNNISEFDLSGNSKLGVLECFLNNLKTLDLSNNTELHLVECFGNKINGKNMDDLIASLPINSKTNKHLTVCGKGYSRLEYDIPINEGNYCTTEQVAAAKARGWKTLLYDGTGESGREVLFEGSQLTFVNIDETNFPDKNFRNYLLAQDYGSDAILTSEEIAAITEMGLSEKGISSLSGIEYFTELAYLFCDRNNIKYLDLSENTKLVTLQCTQNQIGRLILPKECPNLNRVLIFGNRIGFTEMEAIMNALPTRDASARGQIIVKDLSNAGERNACTGDMVNIAKGKQWNVMYSKDGALEYFYGDELAEGLLINEENFPDYFFRRWLSQQDYGKDWVITQLERLYVYEINLIGTSDNIRSLKGIENFRNLQKLWFVNLPITSIDLSKNMFLIELQYRQCPITELDLSEHTALKTLVCTGDKDIDGLASLDLSKNTSLASLNCSENNLTSLDLTNNTLLTTVDCSKNRLTSLDISKNILLEKLYCQENQLKTIEFANLVPIDVLKCYKNQIKDEGMDQLIASLPVKIVKDYQFDVYYSGYDSTNKEYTIVDENVMDKAQVAEAKKRGWVPYWFDAQDRNWKPYEGVDVDGDVNGDIVVDVADIASIINVMATSVEGDLQYTTADVNKDGAVDVADIATVINIMATKARRMK